MDCVVSEDGDGTAARFVPDPSAWIYRVIRQPDGVYREDHDMRKVLVGVRRFRERRNVLEGEPGKRTLAQLEDAVERLEPWLLKTRWYPMTYMAIPGLLTQADEIIAELAAFPARDEIEQARAQELGARLSELRRGFKRRV